MSDQNSGRKTKSFPGNGIDPPHMQSSLSPQGYGLYNFGGGGDADSMLADSTSITSGSSPLKKQTISYNDYVTSHPQHDSSNVCAAMHDSNWNGTTGNENLTALSTTPPTSKSESGFGDIGSGRSYMSTTTAPSFDSKSFGNLSNGSSRNIIDAKALEKSQLQQQQHQLYSSNNSFTGNRAAAASIGNGLKAASSELDRDSKKDRLIDSLSKSDMITCLPGFKKGSIPYKPMLPQIMGDGGNRMSDKVTHHYHLAQQDRNRNVNANSSGPISTVRGPIMPLSSSYARQTPASLSSALNYKRNEGGRSIDGAIIPIGGDVNGSFANGNSNGFAGNSVRNAFSSSSSRSPPPSPISRAKAAIGRSQSEVSKINSFMESEEDRRKPPGSWKNMGTPFFSEPLTRSAQRQQKAQYRIDLERQILASQMRKAEQQRKEKDSNDHPLGPEYAHPALTYYNPPQKISSSLLDQGGTSPTTTTSAAAITKYIKEKYAMDIPSSGGGNTMGAFTSGYPQETGVVGSSTTALGRIAPLQQTKKEKALANLMKSRMHPGGSGTGNGDQNHSTTSSRLLPMNQLQTGGTKSHNGMMVMQPGNDPRFLQRQQLPNQQQQQQPALEHNVNPNKPSQQYQHQQQQLQQHPGFPPQQQQQQYSYPPGTYPPRPYGVNAAWPAMPMYPTYPAYYGAYGQPPMYPSVNQGALIPQQMQPAEVQRQQNYPSRRTPPPSTEPVRSLRSILHDRNVDDEDSCGDEDDSVDFETLKEKAYKAQKIWQTSDELPDPSLRSAVYKVELRKQIDEDRKRKAERLAHEKEEDERIERKIREFHEEERRRIKMEQQTRAELEGYHRHKIEKQRKKSEAFTVSRHMDRKGKDRRPRSRSSLLAEKLASFGPDTGDFQEPETYPYYDYRRDEENEYDYDFPEKDFTIPIEDGKETGRSERRSSPPVPVVQRKLIENYLEDGRHPRRQISSVGQDFLFELKSKLASERDLVERRLKEKIESTHKNMNLLKYTMNHGK